MDKVSLHEFFVEYSYFIAPSSDLIPSTSQIKSSAYKH